MKMKQRKNGYIVASLWLLAYLAGSGCHTLSRPNQRLSAFAASQPLARSAGGRYATTDSYLSLLEIREPSTQILAAVSPLPKDDAILFIAPHRTPEIELAYRVIASLSWPHEIGALHCGANGESTTLLFKPQAGKAVRWLLLFRLNPPDSSLVAAEIGPQLKLIPIKEETEWTSYCSQ